ncbi:unnamed protein product [Mytilus coruscus]|uniref:Uncharacterized protein n=1 Tax=Mytilus coruscus TaxID=42192 RepID=A0A6J8E528_MYTCO|nr:unnamed protein product [Mytilus coruscus]
MLKNNSKAEIYEWWLNSTPMIVSRKLQIKAIPEEPDTQRRLCEKMSLDKMNTEVELFQLRAGSNEKSYQDIDDLMFEEFAKKADGNLLEQICKLWKDECRTEELNSLQRWEKSNVWFNDYKIQFLKEYSSENPFLKKKRNPKSYAQVVGQDLTKSKNNRDQGQSKSRPYRGTNTNTYRRNNSQSRERNSNGGAKKDYRPQRYNFEQRRNNNSKNNYFGQNHNRKNETEYRTNNQNNRFNNNDYQPYNQEKRIPFLDRGQR